MIFLIRSSGIQKDLSSLEGRFIIERNFESSAFEDQNQSDYPLIEHVITKLGSAIISYGGYYKKLFPHLSKEGFSLLGFSYNESIIKETTEKGFSRFQLYLEVFDALSAHYAWDADPVELDVALENNSLPDAPWHIGPHYSTISGANILRCFQQMGLLDDIYRYSDYVSINGDKIISFYNQNSDKNQYDSIKKLDCLFADISIADFVKNLNTEN